MTRRVALIGANGQLAQDLQKRWPESHPGDDLIPLTHAQVEVIDTGSVRSTLERLEPSLVINTSAYHRVDEVEEQPERAFAVNAVGPRNLALACRELDAVLVHMSTDYVFSGRLRRPHLEADAVDPVNVYGASKVAGEMLLRYLWPKHFIVRSSGLYGLAGSSGKGGNFVETMLRLAGEGRPVRVVDDQVLTPTGTWFLAGQIAALVGSDAYGTYHATCQGECSWFQFAAEIFRLVGLEVELLPQTTAESGARALRPAYSVLQNDRLNRIGANLMPDWKQSLAGYIERRDYPEKGKGPR